LLGALPGKRNRRFSLCAARVGALDRGTVSRIIGTPGRKWNIFSIFPGDEIFFAFVSVFA
jgi:hypothetical protein